MLCKVVTHRFDDAAAKHHRSQHLGSTQIEKTILQTKIFTGQITLAWRKRRGLTAVQNLKMNGPNLNITRRQLLVGFAF